MPLKPVAPLVLVLGLAIVPQNTLVAAAAGGSPQAPAAESVVLRSGTPIVMRTTEGVSSEENKAGDVLHLTVIKPVVVDRLVVIAEGAPATARLTKVQKAQRRGRGGQLELAWQTVQLVTGDTVNLEKTMSANGGGTRAMAANMVTAGLLTAGLAAPLFLLQHGEPAVIQDCWRFEVPVVEDLALARAAVAAKQPIPAAPRVDVGVVYVVKSVSEGELLSNEYGNPIEWPLAIGEANYYLLPSSVVRFELPPGRYLLRYSRAATKKLRKVAPTEILTLEVEAGKTYYVQPYLLPGQAAFGLQAIDQAAGAEAASRAWISADIPFESLTRQQIERLRAQRPEGQ